ncbi:MAG: hypothetical protein QXD03_05925, partial [Candidatus Anstonellales archaeon]
RQRNVIFESSGLEGFIVATPVIVVDSLYRSVLRYCTRSIPVDSPKFTLGRATLLCRHRTFGDGRIRRYEFPRIFYRYYDNGFSFELPPRQSEFLLDRNINGLSITRNAYRINDFHVLGFKVRIYGEDRYYKLYPPNTWLDSRGNLDVVFDGGDFTLRLVGSLNFDTGQFVYDYALDNTDCEFVSAEFTVFYSSVKSGPLRPEVYYDFQNSDIDIGILDDFDFVIPPELKQDLFSLYSIDMLGDIFTAIGMQLSYSSEQMIADTISSGPIPPYLDLELDLNRYIQSGGLFRPGGMIELFWNLLFPSIMLLSDRLEKVTGLRPNLLLCGEMMGSILKTLDFNFDLGLRIKPYRSETELKHFSLDNELIDVVISPAMRDEGSLYLYTVAEILDDRIDNINPVIVFEYIPLYTIQETTGGVFKVNFRSRKKCVIQKFDSIGRIRVKGFELLW